MILSGPSGSGKTTLHRALLDMPPLKGRLVKSISATTRPKRPGEKHGRDYLYFSEGMFAARIARGYFLEWEKVFDHYYGTPKRRVINLLKKGQHVLLCIDVKGAARIRHEFPQAVSIFVKTPTLKILRHRLSQRASESPQELMQRFQVAKQEIKESRRYDHIIVNGRLDKATRDLVQVVCQALGIEYN